MEWWTWVMAVPPWQAAGVVWQPGSAHDRRHLLPQVHGATGVADDQSVARQVEHARAFAFARSRIQILNEEAPCVAAGATRAPHAWCPSVVALDAHHGESA